MRRANTWLRPSGSTSAQATSALPSAATATLGLPAPMPALRAGSMSSGDGTICHVLWCSRAARTSPFWVQTA